MVTGARLMVACLACGVLSSMVIGERTWAQWQAEAAGGPRCPQPARVTVVRQVEAVTIQTHFGLDEIAARAGRSSQPAGHRPLGFYIGQVIYKIAWHEGPASAADCPNVLQAVAALSLTGRHIEIGRELAENPCLYRRALLHYGRHATADEAAFERFAENIEAILNKPAVTPDSRRLDTGRQSRALEDAMRSVIDAALGPLAEVRAMIQNSVDTPSEIETLKDITCNQNG
ncbi:hypothetical protein SAMN05519103_04311 [Rhizobiales bacterium GAS113]|nr:hypothetical protein SAMN05519103_04311 [Rhizobiales bacterium GAS113]